VQFIWLIWISYIQQIIECFLCQFSVQLFYIEVIYRTKISNVFLNNVKINIEFYKKKFHEKWKISVLISKINEICFIEFLSDSLILTEKCFSFELLFLHLFLYFNRFLFFFYSNSILILIQFEFRFHILCYGFYINKSVIKSSHKRKCFF